VVKKKTKKRTLRSPNPNHVRSHVNTFFSIVIRVLEENYSRCMDSEVDRMHLAHALAWRLAERKTRR